MISPRYDLLSRPNAVTLPLDLDSERKVVVPTYNRSGAMESISLDGEVYVSRIAYNAKGQRVLMAIGDPANFSNNGGIMTRFAYDPVNFRLLRQRSERFEIPSGFPLTYEAQSGSTKQDCQYDFDLAGNIVNMVDDSPNAGVGGSTTGLSRDFTYDALYRLLTATGRESGDFANSSTPWKDSFYIPDDSVGATRTYKRTYTYDQLGNILKLNHDAGVANTFNRWFNDYDTAPTAAYQTSNFATKVKYGSTTITNSFDANGNMIGEGSSRHFEWDYADQMRVYRTQTSGVEPTVFAHYLYDAGGVRVKKIVRKSTGNHEVTVYIDGVFEYLYLVNSSSTKSEEKNEIHVMDGRSRIARREVFGASWTGSQTDAVKYVLEDHLGNASFTLSASGGAYRREEYFPFGETSFGSYGKKRYRFCGKERDEESGLYYYGARYYMPWQCRFVSVDPLAAEYPFYTPYQYAGNKPVISIDIDGLEAEKDSGSQKKGDNGENPYSGMEQNNQDFVSRQDGIPTQSTGDVTEDNLDANLSNFDIEGITITAKIDKNGPQGSTGNYKREGNPDLETGVDFYTYRYNEVDYQIRSYMDYSGSDWSQKTWEYRPSGNPCEDGWSEFHPNEYNYQDALVIAIHSQKDLLDATYWYSEKVVLPVIMGGIEGLATAEGVALGSAYLRAHSWRKMTQVRYTKAPSTFFGQNPNQVYHAFRHVEELGLNRNVVMARIRANLYGKYLSKGTLFQGTIRIGEYSIQYNAMLLENGSINIGRIHAIY
jgi:RHS repeat-associated protein